MTRAMLFPPLEPFRSGHLRVSTLHELYFEQCGQPHGLPILFLHGGPGAGCDAAHRQFFDPELWQVTLFDQRGAGRSSPLACLEENTTLELVEDIERLRRYLGIEGWALFGGSWGSTLALAYAEAYPERVTGMVLRGIFLGRASEIQWFYQDGARHLFPEAWERFEALIPLEERRDMVGAYYRRLTQADHEARLQAALAWSAWEAATSKLFPSQELLDYFRRPEVALPFARIESHYFVHGIFLEEGQLLREAGRLRGIPGYIIQGRYDVVCPARSAWELGQLWSDGVLRIIQEAGHAASDPGITRALLESTCSLGERLRRQRGRPK